ncbi:MAG TPA: DUF1611 domain-containing protein [Caulobacteraceae bacterium]|jgi:uncharacterized NAD-dependent epimerase/dehydratase family protein
MAVAGPQTEDGARAAAGALQLPRPYLLFVGDVAEPGFAKTAFGLRDWARDDVVGQFASTADAVDLELPRLSPRQAREAGARSLVIGVANAGGYIAESWIPSLLEALEAGLDLVSGLHRKLADVPALRQAAQAHGRQLIDIRTPPPNIPIATGAKRTGKRLLTVGTDCALGKKYTALAIAQAFARRGVAADFRATGQTGILIAGGGLPLDAVVADFVAGAAEMLSPAAADDHWDVIEGQGSLFHPSYAGVSLGLLHGSQPDAIVVCHQPGRRELLGHPGFLLPTVEETIALNLRLARRTNPAVRCAGVSLNTSGLSDADAEHTLKITAASVGLPAADPIRGGPSLERLIDACLEPPC